VTFNKVIGLLQRSGKINQALVIKQFDQENKRGVPTTLNKLITSKVSPSFKPLSRSPVWIALGNPQYNGKESTQTQMK